MSVESLKAKRRTKKKQFNEYVKRRDAINRIINNMSSKTGDDVSDVNNKIYATSNFLRSGLSGVSKISSVATEIYSEKESYVGGDDALSSCSEYLTKEKNRCQSKINSLDREIDDLEKQIKAEGGTIYFWE